MQYSLQDTDVRVYREAHSCHGAHAAKATKEGPVPLKEGQPCCQWVRHQVPPVAQPTRLSIAHEYIHSEIADFWRARMQEYAWSL
jgi:hypothetical protein